MKLFYVMLKKHLAVLRRTLRVFHFFMFSFLLVFTSSRFHFFSFSFLFVLISFHFHFLLFSLFRSFFIVCVTASATFFILRRFLPYTPFCLYQGFPGAGSSSLKVAGLPTEASKNKSTPFACLHHTVFGSYMISGELYLNLSNYVDKLLVGKSLINFKHFS